MSSQIAWLRHGDEERSKSKNVQQKLKANGVALIEIDPETSAWALLHDVDLIVAEYYGYFPADLASLLSQVRANSQAPVVMLTDNQTFEWSAAVIAAGADAVVTVATADEVIVARCQALLRRWRAGR
jgi:DNA-binding response OmpR family regulator